MDTGQRLPITKFIYIRLVLFVPEIILTLAGSVWIFHPGTDCDKDIVWSIRVLVGCQWAVLIVVLVFVAILFNPLGKLNEEGSTAFQQVKLLLCEEVFTFQGKIECCYILNGSNLASR